MMKSAMLLIGECSGLARVSAHIGHSRPRDKTDNDTSFELDWLQVLR